MFKGLLRASWRAWWWLKRDLRETGFYGHPDTVEASGLTPEEYAEVGRRQWQRRQIAKAIARHQNDSCPAVDQVLDACGVEGHDTISPMGPTKNLFLAVLVSICLSGAVTAAALKCAAIRWHQVFDAAINEKDGQIRELQKRVTELEWDEQWRAYRGGHYTP